MSLALRMGMTLAQLRATISQPELTLWRMYDARQSQREQLARREGGS